MLVSLLSSRRQVYSYSSGSCHFNALRTHNLSPSPPKMHENSVWSRGNAHLGNGRRHQLYNKHVVGTVPRKATFLSAILPSSLEWASSLWAAAAVSNFPPRFCLAMGSWFVVVAALSVASVFARAFLSDDGPSNELSRRSSGLKRSLSVNERVRLIDFLLGDTLSFPEDRYTFLGRVCVVSSMRINSIPPTATLSRYYILGRTLYEPILTSVLSVETAWGSLPLSMVRGHKPGIFLKAWLAKNSWNRLE